MLEPQRVTSKSDQHMAVSVRDEQAWSLSQSDEMMRGEAVI